MCDIRRRYGHEVADIVDARTDSYDDPPAPWLARKQQYLEHLPESSPSALGDKVDNVRELVYELRSFDAGPVAAAGGRGASQDVGWYYASLARIFEILAAAARRRPPTEVGNSHDRTWGILAIVDKRRHNGYT